MEGWIKLHRKIIDNAIFSSEKGLKVWLWCLLKARREDGEVYLGKEKIQIKMGEFVFGRETASEELKMKPSTIRNWIDTLKKDSYVDIKPTNKYSIVKVLNWESYQGNGQHSGQQSKNKVKTNGKQMDTNKKVNNVEKVNNGINNTTDSKRNINVDKVISLIKEKFDLQVLDGTDKENRQYAYLLLRKVKEDLSVIETVLDIAAADRFWNNKITAVKPFYYNLVKIASSVKGQEEIWKIS